MIRPTNICEVCGSVATRRVPDRPIGRRVALMLSLCNDCPSPEEIDQRAALVRSRWTDEEFYAKAWDCSLAGVAYRQQYDLRDHQTTTGCVDGRVTGC